MEKHDVYISYSRKDNDTVIEVCRRLDSLGLSYWIDRDNVQLGDTWAKSIADGIKNSSVFLLLCSAFSLNSQAWRNELDLAKKDGLTIFPLLIRSGSDYNWITPHLVESFIGPFRCYYVDNEFWPEALLHEAAKKTSENRVIVDLGSSSLTSVEAENSLEDTCSWRAKSLEMAAKDAVLKLACDRASRVFLDGEFLCEIALKEVVKVPILYGSYILSFEDKDAPDSFKMIPVEIDENQPSKSLIVEMPHSRAPKRGAITGRNELKCFIAGSKTLVRERVVMRSVVSNMYVKWKSQNLLIEAYSFDNFPHTVSDSGHQEEYNQFIDNEADLVLFLFDRKVGENTLKELEIALTSYRQEKRPKIIIYVKNGGKKCEEISVLKERLLKEDIYWEDYSSMDKLAVVFEKDLNDLVMNKVYVENNE